MSVTPLSYALTTKAVVKETLDISVTTWDDLIDRLINSATEKIEDMMGGRRIKDSGEDIIEYYDGDPDGIGIRELQLKKWPINDFTSVAYRSGAYDSPTWNVYSASSDYRRDDVKGVLYFDHFLPIGRQNIRVIYQGGYTTIPDDIERLCVELVVKEFRKRKSAGISNESLGGGSIVFTPDLTDDMLRTINSYKQYSF